MTPLEKHRLSSSVSETTTMGPALLAPKRITDLPEELLSTIARLLQRKDLKKFRLTCKAFSKSGARILFEHFSIYVSNETLKEGAQAIMNSPHLIFSIRHLDLWLHAEEYIPAALSFVSKLHTLGGLDFGMTAGSDHRRALQSLLAEIAKKPASLRRLNLNIRDVGDVLAQSIYSSPNPAYTLSEMKHGFILNPTLAGVLAEVHDLRIQTEMSLGSAPKPALGSMWNKELKARFLHPPSLWLSPLFVNMRRLSLDFGTGWVTDMGYYPKLDFRNTHFGFLEELSLAHFLICHDWVLDWLAKHSATLKVLDLAFCSILRDRNTGYKLDAEGYIAYSKSHPPSQKEEHQPFRYSRIWGDIFDMIGDRFPRLEVFGLMWFTDLPSKEQQKEKETEAQQLVQGLYSDAGPISSRQPYFMVEQHTNPKFGMTTLEDEILASDQSQLSLLIAILRSRGAVCTIEPIFKNSNDFAEIWTDSDTENEFEHGGWNVVEDLLDDYDIDSDGNIWSDSPVKRKKPTEEE